MGDSAVSSNPVPAQAPRLPIPKDGVGPAGVPECYYTSRVLTSTARYVTFVKKLRRAEDEIRAADDLKLKAARDQHNLDFFIKCDRKNLVSLAEKRVNGALASYEQDLNKKRARLIEVFTKEEKQYMYDVVAQMQAGVELVFKDKMDRLAYLSEKRKKEHEEKYKAIPLDKSAHITPCLVKIRAKEAQEVQLYQMREKQMRKMAEREIDNMWYEVAMKESEALAARMELDAMEQARRDAASKHNLDGQLEQLRLKRERDQETLRQEVLYMKAQREAADKQEEEKQQEMQAKRDATSRDREEQRQERNRNIEKTNAENKLLQDMWDPLMSQGLSDEMAKVERQRQMKRELDVCNKKMADMKHRIAEVKFNSDGMILKEGQRLRDVVDLKRCQTVKENARQKKANQRDILKQIKDKKEDVLEKKKQKERDEYNKQLDAQIQKLVKNKEMTELQARRLHQSDLRGQIAYNYLLKERALQEEMDQRKKGQIARDEYQQSINNMLSRAFFSDGIHPFMKQMYQGMELSRWCPCAKDMCVHLNQPTTPK